MLDWITHWIETLGYWGIFGLMVLEHLFPPIPSEIVMPLAGLTSTKSAGVSLPIVILAGSIGSIVGTLAWYVLGRAVSHGQIIRWVERYGRWVTLYPEDVERAIAFFQQGKGGWVVCVGRLVPGVRTYISIPAGLSHMPLISYLCYSAVGTVVWTAALAIAGAVLGSQFDQIQQVTGPVGKVVLISLAVISVIWVVRRQQKHS